MTAFHACIDDQAVSMTSFSSQCACWRSEFLRPWNISYHHTDCNVKILCHENPLRITGPLWEESTYQWYNGLVGLANGRIAWCNKENEYSGLREMACVMNDGVHERTEMAITETFLVPKANTQRHLTWGVFNCMYWGNIGDLMYSNGEAVMLTVWLSLEVWGCCNDGL